MVGLCFIHIGGGAGEECVTFYATQAAETFSGAVLSSVGNLSNIYVQIPNLSTGLTVLRMSQYLLQYSSTSWSSTLQVHNVTTSVVMSI